MEEIIRYNSLEEMINVMLGQELLEIDYEDHRNPKKTGYWSAYWHSLLPIKFDEWLHVVKGYNREKGESYDDFLTEKNMDDFASWYNNEVNKQSKADKEAKEAKEKKQKALGRKQLDNLDSKIDNLEKHNFPVIDRKKYDTDKIYEHFNNKVFKCSKDCFNAWLVNGYKYPETIQYIFKGRKSRINNSETLNFAQLRKFIEKITGDSENTKDAYYKNVFGLTIKCSTIKTSNQFKLDKELKECEIVKK